jgi:cholesterol transport system auxiliary component
MMRPAALLLGLLATGCASHPPAPARYDFDSIRSLVAPTARLHATIVIPPVSTQSWLRTPALIYRLAYSTPSRPETYAQSQWTAPPAELLTLRLRQAVLAANSGFTLRSATRSMDGYRLDVTLEQFVQVFSTPHDSRCFVTLSATLTGQGDRLLAQRTFHSDRPAPSLDGPGAVQGFVDSTDACLEQILLWLQATLPEASSSPSRGPVS